MQKTLDGRIDAELDMSVNYAFEVFASNWQMSLNNEFGIKVIKRLLHDHKATGSYTG